MESNIRSDGGLIFDMGTNQAGSDGTVEVTFHKAFNTPPVVYFTTTGSSTNQVWGVKCQSAPTTTGFTAVTVVVKQTTKDGNTVFSVSAGKGTFQWLAVGT